MNAADYNRRLRELRPAERWWANAAYQAAVIELAGGGCNEHGVYVKPKSEKVASAGAAAGIVHLVQMPCGLWVGSFKIDHHGLGQSSLPSVSGPAYDTRDECRGRAISDLTKAVEISAKNVPIKAYEKDRRGLAKKLRQLCNQLESEPDMPATKAKAKPSPEPAPAEVHAPAPPGVPATSGPETWTAVDLDRIRPCPFNVRRHFDPADIAGLGESIRADRLKEPLLVRPAGAAAAPTYDGADWQGLDHYELADGERRFRALCWIRETYPDEAPDRVPVIVRPMTDERVRAVMLVSREQSRDLSVSELVAGYAELRAGEPDDAAVAALVGKTVGHVRSVLRLKKLPAWALGAVDRGVLPRGTAARVAQVGGDESRKRAAGCALLGYHDPALLDEVHNDADTWEGAAECLGNGTHDGAEPLSDRDTARLIRDHFQKQLKGAPFSLKVVDLVPDTGSCEACPKRAGNDEEAREEGVRADVCLDPDCYRAKVKAFREKEVAKAWSKGIGEADVEVTDMRRQPRGWCFVESQLQHCAPELDVAGVRAKDAARTLKELLDDKLASCARYLAFGPNGKPVTLVKTAEARKALQALGVLKKPEPRPKAPSTNAGSEPAAPVTKSPNSAKPDTIISRIEVGDRAALVAAERCRTMLLANAESLEAMSAAGGPDTDAVYQALSFTARVIVRDWLVFGDDRKAVVERLVPVTAGVSIREQQIAAADGAVGGMTPAEIVGLILGLTTHTAAVDGSRTIFDALYQELLDYADTTEADCAEQARKELTGGEPAEEKVEWKSVSNEELEVDGQVIHLGGCVAQIKAAKTVAKLEAVWQSLQCLPPIGLKQLAAEKDRRLAAIGAAEPEEKVELPPEVEKEKQKVLAVARKNHKEHWLGGAADGGEIPESLAKPSPATLLADIDNFPDAVLDALFAKGVTTLATLLENVDASTAHVDLPLRNKVVTCLVGKLGVELKHAERAADAVAAHLDAKAAPAGIEPIDLDPPVRGEVIGPLGLAAKDLDAAVCPSKIGRPSDAKAKPLPTVVLNERPHVVTGAGYPAGTGRPTNWTLRPLWTETQFANRFPGWRATEEVEIADRYLGVPVQVGKGKQATTYRMGAKHEERKLIAFAPKKGAKAK